MLLRNRGNGRRRGDVEAALIVVPDDESGTRGEVVGNNRIDVPGVAVPVVLKLRQSSRAPFCGELVIQPGDVQAAVLKGRMVHQELPVEDAAELHFGAAE